MVSVITRQAHNQPGVNTTNRQKLWARHLPAPDTFGAIAGMSARAVPRATSLANKSCADPTQHTSANHGSPGPAVLASTMVGFNSHASLVRALGTSWDKCVRRPSSVRLGHQSPTDGLD
jgi:hypothetical protein